MTLQVDDFVRLSSLSSSIIVVAMRLPIFVLPENPLFYTRFVSG